MNSSTTETTKEIAEQLDCGLRAFIHKTSGQLLFVPEENDLTDVDLDPWKDDLELLKKNSKEYHEIEKWTSGDGFEMMSEFANQVSDNNFQRRLFEALKKNKPFREFKFVIDNSGDFRQQWFDFKNKWHQDFVARQLNKLKLIND